MYDDTQEETTDKEMLTTHKHGRKVLGVIGFFLT